MMSNIIPDPDFESFNGVFAGGIKTKPPSEKFDYSAMIKYMKDNKKDFVDLTKEEINSFKTN